MELSYFIGVDVGTASVRAGLFNQHGKLISQSSKALKIWNPSPNHYEQSSNDIWGSTCEAVKSVVEGVDVNDIQGIGFDATCSLVILDYKNQPITVSLTGNNEQNVIMWMDHRAAQETKTINRLRHPALRFVGGKISIEMQLPKLLWLKHYLPDTWKNSKLYFDLPDFLTWKATGCETRSQCSLVCKWNYVVDEEGIRGWQEDLLQSIGLEDLLVDGSAKIGHTIGLPGVAQGKGLSNSAAQEMGLKPGTPVATSLIDAYSGTLGLLACKLLSDLPVHERLALICGTSTCHMLVNPKPLFIPGVWGPYADVLLPGHWLSEAGQSATGKLLDHIIETHPSYTLLRDRLGKDRPIPDELGEMLTSMAKNNQLDSISYLTKHIHVWPDFHGNRSPLADPNLKGMICGLTLDTSEHNLALVYLATIQALCYGTRHIIDSLVANGAKVSCMILCGGLVRSRLFVMTMADANGIPVIIPNEQESVLLGSAMLGAAASKIYPSLEEAMNSMGGYGQIIYPQVKEKNFHDKKYQVFLKMFEDQRRYDQIMESSIMEM